MRVVPLSTYRYSWSPTVSDLLFSATRLATASAKAIEEYLDSAQYREIGLDEAHDTGNEVMLYCEQYIAIPVGLLDATPDPNNRYIILPS